jgi:formylglycine-generating enzyme required for sulfatase activity
LPIVIKIQDIDEAIENLRYKSRTTQKARLLQAIRAFYSGEADVETLQSIDTEELVKVIWETGDDPDQIKAKRKNFSSLKSSVNADLKKLYAEGENPQGLVIGPANTFTISDEAKDKALAGIMDIFREKGIDTQSKLGDILTALSDILTNAVSGSDTVNTQEEIERIKSTLGEITGRLGIPLEDIIRGARSATGESGALSGTEGDGFGDRDGGQTGPGGIYDELSLIDKGLTGLAHELEGAQQKELSISLQRAFTEIKQVLGDSQADAREKITKIMAAFDQILAEAIDNPESGLSAEQAGELKDIFRLMMPPEDRGDSRPESSAAGAAQKLAKAVSDIVADTELGAGNKIGKIMAAVEDLVGEVLDGGNTGLDDAQIFTIKEMMGKLSENLDALAREDQAKAVEVSQDDAGVADAEEILEEVLFSEDAPESDLAAEDDLSEGEIVETLEAEGDAIADARPGIEEIPADALPDDAEEIIEEIIIPEDEPESGLAAGDDLPEGEIVETLEAEGDAKGDAPPGIEEIPTDEPDAGAEEILEEIIIPEAETESGLAAGDDLPEGEIVETLEAEGDAKGDARPGIEEIPSDALPDDAEEIIEEIIIPEDEPGSGLAAGDDLPEGEIVETLEAEGDAPEDEIATSNDQALEEVVWVSDEDVLADEAELSPEQGIGEGGDALTDDALLTSSDAQEDSTDEAIAGDDPTIEEQPDLTGEAGAEPGVTPSSSYIDADLREKAQLLTRLAQDAAALAALGPDLSGSVYTEEEIREKAHFLAEEFNRYLSLRDKFYNAHVLIKGGNYLVGGAHLAKSELPEQIATLPDFYIGKFPVTNAIFEIFVEQTGYITTAERYGYSIVYYPRMQHSRDPVTGLERFSLHKSAYSRRVTGACWHRPLGPESSLHLKRTHPVVHVSLEDARAFASWTGKRLPTEIEWEAAARSALGHIFPWGNEWLENACNTEASLHGDTTPVDRYIKFANEAGVADALGNILEWTGDMPGDRQTAEMCITKGASWIARGEISLTDRHYVEKDASSNILGFRCVAI